MSDHSACFPMKNDVDLFIDNVKTYTIIFIILHKYKRSTIGLTFINHFNVTVICCKHTHIKVQYTTNGAPHFFR